MLESLLELEVVECLAGFLPGILRLLRLPGYSNSLAYCTGTHWHALHTLTLPLLILIVVEHAVVALD